MGELVVAGNEFISHQESVAWNKALELTENIGAIATQKECLIGFSGFRRPESFFNHTGKVYLKSGNFSNSYRVIFMEDHIQVRPDRSLLLGRETSK